MTICDDIVVYCVFGLGPETPRRGGREGESESESEGEGEREREREKEREREREASSGSALRMQHTPA